MRLLIVSVLLAAACDFPPLPPVEADSRQLGDICVPGRAQCGEGLDCVMFEGSTVCAPPCSDFGPCSHGDRDGNCEVFRVGPQQWDLVCALDADSVPECPVGTVLVSDARGELCLPAEPGW